MIEKKNNAYLVKQNSVYELIEVLLDIYSNKDEAIRKCINAKEAIKPYSIESQVYRFLRLIN